MQYRNRKNGKLYFLISTNIPNWTNGHEGEVMVMYASTGPDGKEQIGVREQKEFYAKFDRI